MTSGGAVLIHSLAWVVGGAVGRSGACLRAFKHDHQSSSFTLHLAEHQHPFGPINEIMQILHFQHKSTHMNTLERYHIHRETANNNQLNDKHTVFPNTIFDTLLDRYP
jgi:hypothetical protein